METQTATLIRFQVLALKRLLLILFNIRNLVNAYSVSRSSGRSVIPSVRPVRSGPVWFGPVRFDRLGWSVGRSGPLVRRSVGWSVGSSAI